LVAASTSGLIGLSAEAPRLVVASAADDSVNQRRPLRVGTFHAQARAMVAAPARDAHAGELLLTVRPIDGDGLPDFQPRPIGQPILISLVSALVSIEICSMWRLSVDLLIAHKLVLCSGILAATLFDKVIARDSLSFTFVVGQQPTQLFVA
jgi:hypothetical protein